MHEWAKGLNPDQLEAANTLEGPVLILAGAGAGKTKTMTSRICHMVEEGIRPENILAITFTNKAANEMKERAQEMLAKSGVKKTPLMSTFHSFGYKILRKYGNELGYKKNISICDAEDSKKVLKKIVEETLYKEELDLAKSDSIKKEIKKQIKDDSDIYASLMAKCKDYLLTEKDKAEIEREVFNEETSDVVDDFISVYTNYEKYLKKNNLLDFDDLIEKAVFLLRIDEIKNIINDTYRYINIDEYQDTSRAQFEMVKLLAGKKNNVCVVGDDYQSIYAFRGAVIENILTFPDVFPGCKTIILKANYRSTSHIVNGSLGVIRNNKGQFAKDLYSERGDGEKVVIAPMEDGLEEARFVTDKIEELKDKNGLNYSDFAVLYRKNVYSRTIEDAMLKSGIPYTIYGGVSFYERKEIKDIVAYLKIVAGYDDVVAFERIANFPTRGIGQKTLDSIINELNKRDRSESLIGALGKSSSPKAKQLYDMFRVLRAMAKELPLVDVVEKVLDMSGLLRCYQDALVTAKKSSDPEKIEKAEDRVDSLKDFVSKATEFSEGYEKDSDEENRSELEAFLEEISLYVDADKKTQTNTVSLMTLHRSKGLEFKTVFMIAQDETLKDRSDLEFTLMLNEGVKPALSRAFQMSKFFKECVDMDSFKNLYRELIKANHPDNGGNSALFIEIRADYQACLDNIESMIDVEGDEEEAREIFEEVEKAIRFAKEEERRLFYVGMTRAKDYLFISFAETRMIYGQFNARYASPYVVEIPEEDRIYLDERQNNTRLPLNMLPGPKNIF